MTTYATTASFEAFPAALDTEANPAKSSQIAVFAVTSVGLALSALVYVLGFGAELTWALAAG